MTYPLGFTELLDERDQVLDTVTVRGYFTKSALQWMVASGRWQRPCRGVIVTHNGPLTERQRLRTALLWAGPGAVLGGLTAAWLDGFTGFGDREPVGRRPIYVISPSSRSLHRQPLSLPIVVHYSTMLEEVDVHPAREPRRTRIARSLVDAASWMITERGTRAVLAAGVQQRLVRPADLSRVIDANQRLFRRKLMTETLGDIAGGAQALSELDFTRLVIRPHNLPEPDRQSRRKDADGKWRYLDVVWEDAKVVVEVDGAQHMDTQQYWDDMSRDNDLQIDGYLVLRFPSWLVRHHPEYVAERIRRAIGLMPWQVASCRGFFRRVSWGWTRVTPSPSGMKSNTNQPWQSLTSM